MLNLSAEECAMVRLALIQRIHRLRDKRDFAPAGMDEQAEYQRQIDSSVAALAEVAAFQKTLDKEP